MLVERNSLEELLAADDGRDAVWTEHRASTMRPDPDHIRSNRSLDLFCREVLGDARARFLIPEQSVYLHHDLRISPAYRGETRFHAWMYIHDRAGRVVTEILPRKEPESFQPYPWNSPVRRPGAYLYLGFLIVHFGHLLTEFISRLWPDMSKLPADTRILLHYRTEEERALTEMPDSTSGRIFRSLLAAAGLGGHEVEYVRQDAVYETVLTPTPQNVYRAGARPELAQTAAKLLPNLAPDLDAVQGEFSDKIFYSRGQLIPRLRKYYNAAEVEAVFRAHGFTVVHPQAYPFQKQLAIARRAKVIAGEEGSAFCSAIFADKPVILYLESGRFHPNLPMILYQTCRRMLYLLPVGRERTLPKARLFSQLYADPHELDRQLTQFLGAKGKRPELPRSPEGCSLTEQAFLASLTGDVAGCLEALGALFELDPAGFDPGQISPLGCNLEQAKVPEDVFQIFQETTAVMIRALAGLARRGGI
ncbi:MAG: glycosyltransferase 61 family protein [Desulfovibrionaceae bacterium]